MSTSDTSGVGNSDDQGEQRYAVMLPCRPEDFGEFVSSLLGKPQTIDRWLPGVFEISRQDIINAYHLVDQRIHQQNDATLIQFNIRILYDDKSSVLLNSLHDFLHYTEVRPISSVGATLSWSYLVKFRNKRVPERQDIDLSFRTTYDSSEDFYVEQHPIFRIGPSPHDAIFLRIRHTERTWGVDLESLLSGHVETLLKPPSKAGLFIYRYSGTIGFLSGCLFLASSILGVLKTSSSFVNAYIARVAAIGQTSQSPPEVLAAKIDFLIEMISTGAWSRFTFASILFLVLSGVFAILFGTWIGAKASNTPRSFVLLSKAAEETRKAVLNKRRRDWFLFAVSILASIVAGVISNFIFSTYFSGPR
jgi:hypothetical protein